MPREPLTTPDNIIVNDFDRMKDRIRRELSGHRIDLTMAVIYSIQKDLEIEFEFAHANIRGPTDESA